MIKIITLFGLLLISFGGGAQEYGADFSISGQVKVLYENHQIFLWPYKVEIVQLEKSVESDSLGYFKLDSLQAGIYDLLIYLHPLLRITDKIELHNVSLDNINIEIKAENNWACREMALVDIELKKPRLMIIGGIAPIYYTNQDKIEKKYKFKYYEYGDLINVPEEFIEQYNKIIFEYLDSTFGNKWRDKIRKDVVGFK